ncbi:hypothetical protein CCHR01_18886 [Colletotrichum chrysophilum]|uniref:Uncharacterized protein n=1 Tax=Colletotrichum chrysophilum TaxID=1836956 RepID=A0AAD8ZZ96_9PEZI|nr:hypothetical protein CCHR01_18886 [Colletotrichum chrysophilum]
MRDIASMVPRHPISWPLTVFPRSPPSSCRPSADDSSQLVVHCLDSVMMPHHLHAPKPPPVCRLLFLPYFPHNMSENTQRPKMRCTCV